MADQFEEKRSAEDDARHLSGSEGYFFLKGPGDSSERATINAAGFDGLAFNLTTADLLLYDNKSFAPGLRRDPAVSFVKNLDRVMTQLETGEDIPRRKQIIDLLRLTRLSLIATGVLKVPPNVRVVVTSFGGVSPATAQALRLRGLNLINADTAPPAPAH